MTSSRSGRRGTARRRLLDAGAHLFYEQGITATGVDAIVDAAGTAKQSLYRHFPGGKDELVAAVLAEHDEVTLAALLSAATSRASDPRGRLLALFDTIDEWSNHPGWRGCRFLSAASELKDSNHPGRLAAAAHKRRLRCALETWLGKAGCPEEERSALAGKLLVLVDGALADTAVRPEDRPAQQAREVAELVLEAHFGSGTRLSP